MATIYEFVDEQRRALARIDSAAAAAMVSAYKHLLDDTEAALGELTAAIATAEASGRRVSPSWLYQSGRYRSLITQLQARLAAWAANAVQTAADAQRLALAELRTDEFLRAAFGDAALGISFAPLPIDALEAMVGFTGEGTPLAHLMALAAVAGVDGARSALIRAVALGYGSDRTARDVRDALGVSLVRATTISRTEMHRAFREGVRQAMVRNAELLEGWVWRAAKDRRTCLVCWAKDGTVYQFSRGTKVSIAIMPTHPNCRCAMVPRAKTYAEITGDPSLPDHRPHTKTGPELFAALPPAAQLEILGPARFALYQAGVPLEDMVETVDDPVWGPTTRPRVLADIPIPQATDGSLSRVA